MLVQRPPLRVDHQPQLGQDLVFTLNEPSPVAGVAETTRLVAAPVPAPPALRADTDLALAVWGLVEEVHGLRQDLQRRSLGGRWAAFTEWLGRGWRRLWGGR